MSGRAVVIDWSGALAGERQRIAVAQAVPGRLLAVRTGLNRREAVAHALDAAPVALGLDFSFGLPAWFARAHGCADIAAFWGLVAEEGEAWLAACAPPFWGRAGTRKPTDRELYRRSERAALAVGLPVKSSFQIGGAGSVGTGSVRGMPLLPGMREQGASIWPFDDAGEVTVVEVYPRAFTGPVVKSSPAARRALVAAESRIPEGRRDVVVDSEDAFDAAFAALGLAEDLGAVAGLRASDDPDERLEGAIWLPTGVR